MDFTESYSHLNCSLVGLCARAGRSDELKHLLDQMAPIDVPDNRRWFPLHEAAFSGHTPCVQLIVEHASSFGCLSCFAHAGIGFLERHGLNLGVNKQAFDGSSALLLACQKRSPETAKLLLDAGADPNLGTLDEMTPLIQASNGNVVGLVELLLAHNANPNGRYWNGWTAVHEAASTGNVEVLKQLLDAGGSPSVRDDAGLTPVFVSAQYGHSDALELLLKKTEDPKSLVNTAAFDGATPLYIAIQEGYDHYVAVLLSYGCDVNQSTEENVHVVLPAVKRNFYRCLDLILPYVDVQKLNTCPEDPVYVATEEHSLDCLKRLVHLGCPLDRTTEFHRGYPVATYSYLLPSMTKSTATPLGQAVHKKDVESVKILLDAGASMHAVAHNCHSPLLLAVIQRKNPEILQVFLERNVDLNSQTQFGVSETILVSIHSLYRDQMITLLKGGAKPNLRNWCGCKQTNPNQETLLSQLLRIYTPAELSELLAVVHNFSAVLPNCCQSWMRVYREEHSLLEAAGTPIKLHDLCRLAIREQLSTVTLLSTGWPTKLLLPDTMISFLCYHHL